MEGTPIGINCTEQVDMLVGDIYGDRDYSNIGLSASTIACSFGKVIAGGPIPSDDALS